MTEKQHRKTVFVQSILDSLAKVKERPLDEKGGLDIQAFNELAEVKTAVARLKKGGITKKWLWKHFTVAGMLLKI